MNVSGIVHEVRVADRLLKLIEVAEATVTQPRGRLRALLLLVAIRKRLTAQKRRWLEDALVELLWQYLDTGLDDDTVALVRQLIADIAAG